MLSLKTKRFGALRKTAAVLGLLLCLVLCAVPVFGADEPTQSADRHYNHFTVDIVASYGMLDSWVNANPGRAVSFERDTNTINITYTSDDVGTTILSSPVPVDDFMPFFLSGDNYVYYAGGGGTYNDGGGFSLVFSSMETGANTRQPRAYELSYLSSAQNTAGGATVQFSIRIPSDATGGLYSIPYIGIYRVNDLNRSHFYMPASSAVDFGTGSTDVAQGIFVPFDLNNLIDYERNQGYTSGYYRGQQDGYTEGQGNGYDAGYQDGETRGFERGTVYGYDLGYADGFVDGTEEGGSAFIDLIGAVISIPVEGLMNLLSFEILGIDMLAFFGSILTVLLLYWLVKLLV